MNVVVEGMMEKKKEGESERRARKGKEDNGMKRWILKVVNSIQ